MAARDEAKGRDAILSIQSSLETPVDIRCLQLDLASFESIHAAADKFTSECNRLDTLILNAGVMAVSSGTTKEGFDLQLGTNHIGHVLLTKLLLPTLRKTAAATTSSDVRMISVSSAAWQVGPSVSVMMNPEMLSNTTKWTRYGASKIANILFAAEFSRRYPEITAVSLHPGAIDTGLYDHSRNSNPIVKYGMAVAMSFFSTPKEGALSHLWAAGVKKEKLTNGEYYTPVGQKGWRNPHVYDEEAGRTLWEWTEGQICGK